MYEDVTVFFKDGSRSSWDTFCIDTNFDNMSAVQIGSRTEKMSGGAAYDLLEQFFCRESYEQECIVFLASEFSHAAYSLQELVDSIIEGRVKIFQGPKIALARYMIDVGDLFPCLDSIYRKYLDYEQIAHKELGDWVESEGCCYYWE